MSLFSLATRDSKPVSLSVASIPQATFWEEGRGVGWIFLSPVLFSFSSFLLFFAILSLGASLDWFLDTKMAAEPLVTLQPSCQQRKKQKTYFQLPGDVCIMSTAECEKATSGNNIIILNNTSLLDSAVWKLYKILQSTRRGTQNRLTSYTAHSHQNCKTQPSDKRQKKATEHFQQKF